MAESSRVQELVTVAEEVGLVVAAPQASLVDAAAAWPEASMRALAESGLLGLHVPVRLGGHGQGLLGLAVITETIGKACSSTGLCFGMHSVATAVIAAKATRDQEERFLAPIAAGQHISSLALSEAWSGSHFYLPSTRIERDGDSFVLQGDKRFVTSGGHADSYVLSTLTTSERAEAGEFNLLVVESESSGMRWGEPWAGFGMRGNSSRSLTLDGVRVPAENLLGEEGDQIWYVFEVVAPYFLVAMAATYLGIAQGALDEVIAHVRTRRHEHAGETLSQLPGVQQKVASLWVDVQKSRQLLHLAAELGDAGDPQALPYVLSAKAEIADTAVNVTNEAMTLCGGIGYRENGRLARLLRDARASHIMAPTTDLLRLWAGRTVLGLPLL